MAFLQVLYTIESFVFGHWSPLMGTILVFIAINFFWDCRDKKPYVIEASKILAHKLAAYITFFAIAHQADRLAANELLEFEGATQFFVALYVIVRELKKILSLLRSRGIDVPWILSNRAKMLEDTMNGLGPPANENIDAKIRELKKSMEKLKELQHAGNKSANEVQDIPE